MNSTISKLTLFLAKNSVRRCSLGREGEYFLEALRFPLGSGAKSLCRALQSGAKTGTRLQPCLNSSPPHWWDVYKTAPPTAWGGCSGGSMGCRVRAHAFPFSDQGTKLPCAAEPNSVSFYWHEPHQTGRPHLVIRATHSALKLQGITPGGHCTQGKRPPSPYFRRNNLGQQTPLTTSLSPEASLPKDHRRVSRDHQAQGVSLLNIRARLPSGKRQRYLHL